MKKCIFPVSDKKKKLTAPGGNIRTPPVGGA